MIWVQNGIITAIAVPFFFMIQDAPKLPPSLVAMKEPEDKSIMPTFKKLKDNRNFMLLLLVFAMMESCFFCFSACIHPQQSIHADTCSRGHLLVRLRAFTRCFFVLVRGATASNHELERAQAN